MTAVPGPDGSNKFQRYRSNQRQRGLKLVRLWVADPHAPGFREEADRQAALLDRRPEEVSAAASNGLKRGDIISITPGAPGKRSRQGVVIQSDGLLGTENILACQIGKRTEAAPLYRLPFKATGKVQPEQDFEILTDKIIVVPRDRCEALLGRLQPADVAALNRLLALTLGLAD